MILIKTNFVPNKNWICQWSKLNSSKEDVFHKTLKTNKIRGIFNNFNKRTLYEL